MFAEKATGRFGDVEDEAVLKLLDRLRELGLLEKRTREYYPVEDCREFVEVKTYWKFSEDGRRILVDDARHFLLKRQSGGAAAPLPPAEAEREDPPTGGE